MLAAALQVERPVFFSILMIVGAFLPLLTLTRIEGLLFRPMARTIVFALGGAALFALVVVPVLATMLFRHCYREWNNPVLARLSGRYAVLLSSLMRHRWLAAACSVAVLASVFVVIVPRMGTEFLPYMDEGVIWVRANFPEGTSLQQTSHFGRRLREVALEFPDIQFAAVQTGRNDSGTDPYPPSRIEMMVGPKPRDTWVQFKRKQELIAALGTRFSERISHHPFQLHSAHHRQCDRGYRRYFGQHGDRVFRRRFRDPASPSLHPSPKTPYRSISYRSKKWQVALHARHRGGETGQTIILVIPPGAGLRLSA